MPKTAARLLLTDFLKSRRARLCPNELGFQALRPRRRTKGLRRSEVAQLAGMSTEWYTLFEMGRDRAMTQRIVEPVSRALRLNEAERDYLNDLVRGEPPLNSPQRLHPSIEFAVQHVVDAALAVYDAWLTCVRANEVARQLFLMGNDVEPLARNVLWRLFTEPKKRELAGSAWAEHARRNVGLFRRSLARDPLNPKARCILDRLTGIREFDQLWAAHDVYSSEMYSNDSVAAPDVLYHPIHGTVALHTLMLEIPGSTGGHVRYMTPADKKSADVLRAVGLHRRVNASPAGRSIMQ